MSRPFVLRRDKLRHAIRKLSLGGLLVTHPTNVTYLTGFTGDSSCLLLTNEDELLITDARFSEQLAEECPSLNLELRSRVASVLDVAAKEAEKRAIHGLGIESDHLTLAAYDLLSAKWNEPPVKTSGLVETLREIKDSEEIGQIRAAVKLAEKSMGLVRTSLLGAQTELQVAADIEHAIRRFGGRGCSFRPIVAVGERAALPHAPPTAKRIEESNFVLIDWGACERLYMSDLTRVFVTGKLSAKLEEIYSIVLRAQQVAIEWIKPGALMQAVDTAARSVISEAGYGERFGHGLGHGIGLEVHEAPRLVDNSQRQLKPGMVVTVEPGIYLPGWGGVRIEDDVLVTRDGHEVLSSLPKKLESCIV